LLAVYIIMLLMSFIGIQVYRNTSIEAEPIVSSGSEISAEVVLVENNFNTSSPEETEVTVGVDELNLASFVTTKVVEKPVEVAKEVTVTKIQSDIRTEFLGSFKVSGYCKCNICSANKVGKDIMSDYKGVNATCNSDEISFGTKIWIEGVGIRQTQPSGQKLTKNEIKVYFATHEEVVNFGTKTIDIYKVLD